MWRRTGKWCCVAGHARHEPAHGQGAPRPAALSAAAPGSAAGSEESVEPSAHERVLYAQLWKAAEVSICGPEGGDSVVDGESGDASIVDASTLNLACNTGNRSGVGLRPRSPSAISCA